MMPNRYFLNDESDASNDHSATFNLSINALPVQKTNSSDKYRVALVKLVPRLVDMIEP